MSLRTTIVRFLQGRSGKSVQGDRSGHCCGHGGHSHASPSATEAPETRSCEHEREAAERPTHTAA